jgi:regulator of protease activity HflC (stomatin/prohibitin superfamily)
MPHMGVGEFAVIALLAVVRYGIPIAFAVWIFRSLRCIRADQAALITRLETIERLMNKAG